MTIPIPLVTVPGGSTVPGSVTVPSGITQAKLLPNRQVGSNPMSGIPTLIVDIVVEFSLDGGASWISWSGQLDNTQGRAEDDPGVIASLEVVVIGDSTSTTRQVRARINTNASFTTSGSLVLS